MYTEKQCYGGKNKYCVNVPLSPNLFQRFIHATSLREFLNGSVQLVVFLYERILKATGRRAAAAGLSIHKILPRSRRYVCMLSTKRVLLFWDRCKDLRAGSRVGGQNVSCWSCHAEEVLKYWTVFLKSQKAECIQFLSPNGLPGGCSSVGTVQKCQQVSKRE